MPEFMADFKRGFMRVWSPVLIGAMYLVPSTLGFLALCWLIIHAMKFILIVIFAIALVSLCYTIGDHVQGRKHNDNT